MASMKEQICRCGKKFMARTTDIKRGWGKSCSKSCAAIKSNKETGKYRKLMNSGKVTNDDYDYENDFHPFESHSLGQWE